MHKIGVTSGSVEKRIAGASQQPTFLLADVEVVATYQLFNISRAKLENLIHRFSGQLAWRLRSWTGWGGQSCHASGSWFHFRDR